MIILALVILVNPNNPVGNVYSEEDLKKILKRTKEKNAILVVVIKKIGFCGK